MRPLLFTEQGEFYHKNLLFQQKDEPFRMIHLLKDIYVLCNYFFLDLLSLKVLIIIITDNTTNTKDITINKIDVNEITKLLDEAIIYKPYILVTNIKNVGIKVIK
jgi:hypothetical protein